MDKADSVDVGQSVLGRAFGYSDVTVRRATGVRARCRGS
jgi:hypothetical protein